MQPNNFFLLEQIIDRQPLTVAPEIPLAQVINLMQEWGNSCNLTVNAAALTADASIYSNNSCVLVEQNSRLLGIFTERDLVKLIARGVNPKGLTVAEVMSRNVVTLTVTGREDLFSALSVLRQHHIRHLPVLDERRNLLGLVTAKNLRQKLQPINLMQWRKVSEVMNTEVIHAALNDSVRHVARLMADSEISCVAIAETMSLPKSAATKLKHKTNSCLVRPVGIITERDIVQFQNLNLDLEQPARNLMSAPLFLVSPEDTLWSVHQQMQQRRVRRLLVEGARGELRGIITQTSLLEIFDPTEMYGVIEVLQREVCHLELERTQLLENRQAELETQVREQTNSLEIANQRLQLEVNLRQQSEHRFDSILSYLEDVVYSVDPNTSERFYINLAAEKIYAYQVAEFYHNPDLWLEVVHPEDRQRASDFALNVIKTGAGEIEYRIIRADGEVRWLYDRARLIRDADERSIRLDGIATDISDRKRRENILRDIASGLSVEVGENFLQSLVEYLSKTLKVDRAFIGKLVQPNGDSIETLAVYAKGKIIDNFAYLMAGTPCEKIIERKLCIYPEAIQQLFPHDRMLPAMEAESYAGIPIFDSRGAALGLIAILDSKPLVDLSLIEEVLKIFASRVIAELERKQAEKKIREQAALLDIATDAIMVRGLDNKILFWNRGAEKIYGWTKAEAVKRNANELLYRGSLAELNQIQQTVIKRGEWQGELNQITQEGREIVVKSRWTLIEDEAGHRESILVVNTDITEQKQLEAEFLRTQRLESLGTLASGIAHDLNNILSPILGFSRLIPLKLPNLDDQTKEFFKIIETNAQRGSALVKQILTFARGLEGDRGIVQIRHLISEIDQIVRETFSKTIDFEINMPKNLWTVNGDVNQLHQVLMNLAVNARDAMPEGGKLTITAENFIVDGNFARLHLDAVEGSYVLITVADTGVGIPPEILDRIFEPFFTTKEIGRGTGLGLSTVIGIVKSHGGFVDVTSHTTKQETRGTQLKVFLPASETAAMVTQEREEIPRGNGELILVVDDENSMLEVTKATLETFNYQVLTANNGIDAIAIYTQNMQAIELALVDIMMPSMNGKIVIRTLKKINPELQIIAFSGLIFSQEIIAEINDQISTYIAKPYSNEELLKSISKILTR
ncbi:CBS domain-containing protein [Myxosarcina sp. GI1(2024)]